MNIFWQWCSSVVGLCINAGEALAGANAWLLALAIILHLLCKLPRAEAWANIVRSATDKPFSSVGAWKIHFLTSGIGTLLPSRGGDLLKAGMSAKRTGSRYSTMVATLGPEGLFESMCGLALLVWAGFKGYIPMPDPALLVSSPLVIFISLILICALWLVSRKSQRVQLLVRNMAAGFAILKTPRSFIIKVASLQLLSRVLRLFSIMCFLAAFSLPASLTVALAVMAIQGAARIVPIGIGQASVQMVLLSGMFITMGLPVATASLTAYLAGSAVTNMAAALILAAPLLIEEMGSCSWSALKKLRDTHQLVIDDGTAPSV